MPPIIPPDDRHDRRVLAAWQQPSHCFVQVLALLHGVQLLVKALERTVGMLLVEPLQLGLPLSYVRDGVPVDPEGNESSLPSGLRAHRTNLLITATGEGNGIRLMDLTS
jgi:hypothetical protein